MYQILKKSLSKNTQIMLYGLSVALLLLVAVVYKSDDKLSTKTKLIEDFNESADLKTFKEFLLNHINSPFINLNYEIQKGDTIQKILKKYKVQNNDINQVIIQYKKYAKSNQLLAGNKINIIIKKNISADNNSIVKFDVPITKSTNIAITRNEENKIISQKIITKLYKKKFFLKI